MNYCRWRSLLLVVVALFCNLCFSQTVLRVVPHADLKNLDPIWTTAYITRNHGYMIYDTLFAMDENLKIQPQMVDRYQVSDDGLTWTFTLREGLKWHDGKPVTAEDCVASLKRWAARDGKGQLLFRQIKSLTAPNQNTIKMQLRKPYGLVLESLAKPSSNVPFMMPKRVAATDPFKQITDYTGSGPFIFKKDEWLPGSKVVYVKNKDYVPRKEPASFAAGGKIPKVDRVEWLIFPDKTTAINALDSGEVDFVELFSPSLLPVVESNPDIVVDFQKSIYMGFMRFNALIPPFNNPKIRRAAILSINQKDYLTAAVGSSKYWQACFSVYTCGFSRFTNDRGADIFAANSLAKAKALLQEAHYDGTPVVILQSTDIPELSNFAVVAADALRKIGMKVQLVPLDWGSLTSRRANRGPVSQGGWNIFVTGWSWLDIFDPTAIAFSGDPEKGWFGWIEDPKIESLRADFTQAKTFGEQKEIAAQIQAQLADVGAFGLLGHFSMPNVYRKNLKGVISSPVMFLWNISKE